LSVESAKTPSLAEESTPYAPSATLYSGSKTFSPMRQPLGELPIRSRLSPSSPTMRESVLTPSVALLAPGSDLVKPGGNLFEKSTSPGPTRPW
jgi:hypothetical protein